MNDFEWRTRAVTAAVLTWTGIVLYAPSEPGPARLAWVLLSVATLVSSWRSAVRVAAAGPASQGALARRPVGFGTLLPRAAGTQC
jgi:hypothetical protein